MGIGAKQPRLAAYDKIIGMQRTNDQRNHACAIATGGLEPLDELLDLPYLDLKEGASASMRDIQARHGGVVESSR